MASAWLPRVSMRSGWFRPIRGIEVTGALVGIAPTLCGLRRATVPPSPILPTIPLFEFARARKKDG